MLGTSLAGGQTGPVSLAPAGRGQGPAVGTDGFDALAAARGDGPLTFPRQVAWWPFTTGPHYGDVEVRDEDLPDDVLLTHVGSFRIGQGLAIPAELTGSLGGDRGGPLAALPAPDARRAGERGVAESAGRAGCDRAGPHAGQRRRWCAPIALAFERLAARR